jgi:hypothetical protein
VSVASAVPFREYPSLSRSYTMRCRFQPHVDNVKTPELTVLRNFALDVCLRPAWCRPRVRFAVH